MEEITFGAAPQTDPALAEAQPADVPEVREVLGAEILPDLELALQKFERVCDLVERPNPFKGPQFDSANRWSISKTDLDRVQELLEKAKSSSQMEASLPRLLVRPFSDIFKSVYEVEGIWESNYDGCIDSIEKTDDIIDAKKQAIESDTSGGDKPAALVNEDELRDIFDELAQLDQALPNQYGLIQLQQVSLTGITFYKYLQEKREKVVGRMTNLISPEKQRRMRGRKIDTAKKNTEKEIARIIENEKRVRETSAAKSRQLEGFVDAVRKKGAEVYESYRAQSGGIVSEAAIDALWRLCMIKSGVDDLYAQEEGQDPAQLLAAEAYVVNRTLEIEAKIKRIHKQTKDTNPKLDRVIELLINPDIQNNQQEKQHLYELELTRGLNGSVNLCKDVLKGGDEAAAGYKNQEGKEVKLAETLHQLGKGEDRLLDHQDRGVIAAILTGKIDEVMATIKLVQAGQGDQTVAIMEKRRPETMADLRKFNLDETLIKLASILTGGERSILQELLSEDDMSKLDTFVEAIL